jgi:hypothetical protein
MVAPSNTAGDGPRVPVAETYDASVGLEPVRPGEIPSYAYALVKMTYAITPRGLALAAPEPLLFDLHRSEPAFPPLPPGSDYWLDKVATDVVIRGAACAPGQKPLTSMQVAAQVGPLEKRVAVSGRREIRWLSDGRIDVGAPEPFTEMPLVYSNCYGGLDPRVPIPEDAREEFERYAELGIAADHPGLYPRNPIGKGYCVLPEPLLGLEMPNLEDPDDRLTASRLVTGAPELWYRQPLPWCFETTHMLMYPRLLLLGLDAWFPAREPAKMPEFYRGLAPIEAAAPVEARSVDLRAAYQEASLGMVGRVPLAGAPVRLTGMHPELTTCEFLVPDDPVVDLFIDGQKMPGPTLLTHLVIRPGEQKVSAVWCARVAELPRKFVPGFHANIPLALSVNRGPLLQYESPPTVRERLSRAAPPVAPSVVPPVNPSPGKVS